jgi:hypothetical protein
VTSPTSREAIPAARTPSQKLTAADHFIEEIDGILKTGAKKELRLVSLDVICLKGRGGKGDTVGTLARLSNTKNRLIEKKGVSVLLIQGSHP